MRRLACLLILSGFVAPEATGLIAPQAAWAAKIEAVPGKEYSLSKQHGPWMIMVATFSASLKTDSDAEMRQQLENADKAAHDLVLELRRKGIPAYIHVQKGKLEEVDARDRYGNPSNRYVASQRNRISVIAGNYPAIDDKVAQQTLKYIKKLEPASLVNGVYKSTEGRKGPLSRAFLTLNPLLSSEEIAQKVRERDPLLLQLNSKGDFNLTENPGKYTLVVASFYGKSQTHILAPGSTMEPLKFMEFDNKLKTRASLDEAGMESWGLVTAMRQQGIEAYVYHERFRSIVTVGSFSSPTEARVKELAQRFGAKTRKNPQTQQNEFVSECIQLKNNIRDGNEVPYKLWTLDPDPQVIEVPHLR